jgi:SAM-dependent methyltransferase
MNLEKLRAIYANYGVRLWKSILQRIYHFDKWHIVSLRQRKYARDIIGWCNQRTVRNSFLEIGCGLGDIVRKVRYREKQGLDNDPRVLKAAAFLEKMGPGTKTRFSVFNFPGDPVTGKYDVILMVNWIHHIDPVILASRIREYFSFSLHEGGVIIIDTVQDPEYKFNHDIQVLTKDIPATIGKLGDYERQRQIWLIKK